MIYELFRKGGDLTSRELAASGFAFTKAGVVLPTISGSLSFISSCLIIVTILRSKQNTPYHRIMFFMSFWDSLSSLSIALTTIPMPRDVVYNYAGPSYGNTRTCEAQAFIILTGLGFVLTSNIMLNVYYLCTIRYNIVQETFQKYAEPIFLMIAIPLSFFQPIYFVIKETLNPTPYDSFCMMELYPADCRSYSEPECIRGDRETYKTTVWRVYQYFLGITVGLQILILIITMLFIVHTAWSRKEDTDIATRPNFSQRKSVTLQAFMYICACLMTWIFAVLFSMFPDNRTMNALFLLFVPMQGFINLMIFMFHKVYTYKVFHNVTVLDAIKIFFTKPSKFADRYLVSNIENIETLQPNRKTPSEIHREICQERRPSYSLPSQEIILNDDEIGIKSVELSIQLSSNRDIDSFLDNNMDVSLADTSKQSFGKRKDSTLDENNDNTMKEALSNKEKVNENEEFLDE